MSGHLWQVLHGVLHTAYRWIKDVCLRKPDLSGNRARRVMTEKASRGRWWMWLPIVRLGACLSLRVPRPGSNNAGGLACIS